ncbi:MAG: cardiolipin synthase ClsB [Inhella sp.]|uniref:cardiolipin synthase ClsB n=1 Tax=Inhella sp. TaxID=1921806 RepID=UPI0022C04EDC|nr:cardiolipin synthase ClsB [Inhella sp.]MCZ8236563.1 cardiolipin synthase ClsB [Inhella sp.]
MTPWREQALPQGGHEVDLLRGGDALFPAMEQAIDRAEAEVWLASYIVHTDEASQRILQALLRADRRGVRVRVVVDGFGSRAALPWWQQQLSGSRVALAVFRPIDRWWHWLQPGQLRRLHHKLCVVDDATAFVGGINLLDDRLDLNHGPLDTPRLDFALGLRGPVVGEVQHTVRRTWTRAWLGHEVTEEWQTLLLAPEPLQRARRWLRARWNAWRGTRAELDRRRQQRQEAEGDERPVRLAFVRRDNLSQRHAIEREYLLALRDAREQADLICPYFYPSARLLRALHRAAKRGVRIRLLLQGRFDYRLAEMAARALYVDLLQRGVRIFEYRAAFLHAKVAQVDGHWCTVGSSNLDPTSLVLNLEANVVAWDRGLADRVRHAFDEALTGAEEIHPTTWLPGSQGLRGWLRRALVGWVAQVYLRAAGGGPY